MYEIYGIFYARNFCYMTASMLHRKLTEREKFSISFKTVQRHLKWELGARTKYCVFKLDLLSKHMPIVPAPKIPEILPFHPNHPNHSLHYFLHLKNYKDKILLWHNMFVPVKVMSEEFTIRYAQWNGYHSLDGPLTNYRFRPYWSNTPFDIVETKRSEANSLAVGLSTQKELGPIVRKLYSHYFIFIVLLTKLYVVL
jgi:hypothetical protein